jgi:transposase-like protein
MKFDVSTLEFPANELEFDSRFNDEASCKAYLRKKKHEAGFGCLSCGHTEFWQDKRDYDICCKCEHQHSVTCGTLFHSTKKPLRLWFKVLWWYSTDKGGLSAKRLQSLLDVSYTTAWAWLAKIRTACDTAGKERLSGDVEVDEFFLGAEQEGKTGRGSENKAKVIVAVEKQGFKLGRVRMRVIESCDSNHIGKFIDETINKGSRVITDGWRSYQAVLGESDYSHERLVASISDEDVTPGVHRVASLFKRMILGTYHGGVSHKRLQEYLDEFIFRFNRKESKYPGKIFDRAVEAILSAQITIKKLFNKFT